MIKIGVDAMGGDYAPEAAVKGAVMALDAIGSDSRIVLFGDEQISRDLLRWLYTAITRATEKLYFINFDERFFDGK